MTSKDASTELGLVASPTSPRGDKLICEAERKNIPIARRKIASELWSKIISAAIVATKFVNELDARRKLYNNVDNEGTVFWHIKLVYALPQLCTLSFASLISGLLIIFYINVCGVEPSFIAFFQIFARSFDVLTDPLMAHISDNLTNTKIGRRKPYILCAPLYAISFFIFCNPPTNNKVLATYWFGGSYLLFYICDTITNVPLIALGPELSDDSDKRNELYLWVKLAEGAGLVGVTSIAPIFFINILKISDANAFRLIGIIFGIWYIITMYLLAYVVKERPASIVKNKNDVIQPFVTSFYRSWRNKAFRPLLIGWLLDFAGFYLFQAMLPFFIAYYVEVEDATSTISFAYGVFFVSAAFSIPLFYYFSLHSRKDDSCCQRLKIGKRNAWILYNVMLACTNFLYVFIYQGSTIFMYIAILFNGFPLGGNFLANSTVSDVVDYDEFLNFKRNDAQFTVFATFIPKLVAIPCQSLPLAIIYMLGFKNPPQDADGNALFLAQSRTVKWFIRITFVYVPIVLTGLSVLTKMLFYPIKNRKILRTIENGITKHLQGKPAWDPVTKKDVWIEKLENDEQYLQYLLDQFSHHRILWLLSPDEIYKRHAQNGMPLRQSTLKHITTADNNTAQQISDKSPASSVISQPNGQTNTVNNTNNTNDDITSRGIVGCCCCKKQISDIHTFGQFDENVKFGKNKKGEVVYMSVAKYEAHGLKQGTIKLKWVMALYIFLSILSCCLFVGASVATFSLIADENYAIFPAMACLGIGLSFASLGFNILKFKAANEIYVFCQEKHIGTDIIAKIVYPKVKGQRGGEALDREDTLLVDQMVPQEHAHPDTLKSISDLNLTNLYNEQLEKDEQNNELYN